VSTSNWIAVAALAVSLAAVLLSLLHRRLDMKREEEFGLRSRAWLILDREPGLRTVQALDDVDGETSRRVKLLGRTARQLKVADVRRLSARTGAPPFQHLVSSGRSGVRPGKIRPCADGSGGQWSPAL